MFQVMPGEMPQRDKADFIVKKSINAVLPEKAVEEALKNMPGYSGKLILVAIGKAAYRMGKKAAEILGNRISSGMIITKYGHAEGKIDGIGIFEAGHPVPDENSYSATEKVLEITKGLSTEDMVLFLVSGGGSALFEKPLISGTELENITEQLLRSGASIKEMNVIRKRLSSVKGGKFALHCMPAKIYAVVLSDVLGDRLDTIASGPAYSDSSTVEDAVGTAGKYGLELSDEARKVILLPPVTEVTNVTTVITGNVSKLCEAARNAAEELGYRAEIVTEELTCEASEAGRMLAEKARQSLGNGKRAYIYGGETVVHVRGNGRGGRNQELVLSAACGIQNLKGVTVFSFGSDGTDGPTDAAGGIADGDTVIKLKTMGINADDALSDNDSYNALKAADSLIMTGPTGTNVNDVAMILTDY